MLHTGLRAGEVRFLQWSHADLELRTLRFRGKGDKERTVYISTVLRDALYELRSIAPAMKSRYVFPSDRTWEALAQSSIERMIRRAGERIGKDLHPHMLRHTYISTALNEKSAPLQFVQNQVGHANASMTMKYSHISKERSLELAELSI